MGVVGLRGEHIRAHASFFLYTRQLRQRSPTDTSAIGTETQITFIKSKDSQAGTDILPALSAIFGHIRTSATDYRFHRKHNFYPSKNRMACLKVCESLPVFGMISKKRQVSYPVNVAVQKGDAHVCEWAFIFGGRMV